MDPSKHKYAPLPLHASIYVLFLPAMLDVYILLHATTSMCLSPDFSLQGIAMLPEGTIQASLALGKEEANKLIAGLPVGVVEGEMECLKRCGLAY